jgi:hypothetical protein
MLSQVLRNRQQHSILWRRQGTLVPISLPYEFDTSSVWRTIFKGAIVVALIVGVSIVGSVLIGRYLAALQLAIIGGLILAFGLIAFKYSSGSVGTISREGVIVHQGKLYGYQLPGPSGTFPLDEFKSVRVERVAASTNTNSQGQPHQRVYLVGNPGTPSILIGRTDSRSQLGQEIAAQLNLSCEETHAPY